VIEELKAVFGAIIVLIETKQTTTLDIGR